jgi:hypothetical protein
MIVDDVRRTVADGRSELSARAVAPSVGGFDSAGRRVEELQERLLIAHADHR